MHADSYFYKKATQLSTRQYNKQLQKRRDRGFLKIGNQIVFDAKHLDALDHETEDS